MTIQAHELEHYMQQYGNDILRLCYTYVHNWQTAEDLTQDTFIKLYKHADQFRHEAAMKTYLYRIAINVCKTYVSSWKFKSVTVSNAFHKLLKTSHDTEQQVLLQSDAEQLVRAIEQLPVKYKDVIVLFYYAELSLQEISEALNIPLNTVKTQLSRAKKQLKIDLQQGDDDIAFNQK